jgi:hypothetical protein
MFREGINKPKMTISNNQQIFINATYLGNKSPLANYGQATLIICKKSYASQHIHQFNIKKAHVFVDFTIALHQLNVKKAPVIVNFTVALQRH